MALPIALAADASRLASLLLSYVPAPRHPGASPAIIDRHSHPRALGQFCRIFTVDSATPIIAQVVYHAPFERESMKPAPKPARSFLWSPAASRTVRIGSVARLISALGLLALCATALSACNRGSESSSGEESSVAETKGVGNGGEEKDNDAKTSATEGARRRYDVERGTIEFTLDGMQVGKETLQFKNYGLLEVKHSEAKISLPKGLTLPTGADPGEKKLVTIIDGTTTINYDPTTKAGTKLLHTLELLGGEEKFKGKSMAAMGEEMYTNMGGTKTGTKTVAGLSCDVWKIDKLGTESCIHKGITLEVTTELVGMKQHSIATKVDFEAKVDDAAFEVPKDVQLRVTDLKKQGVLPGAGPAAPGKKGQALTPEEALRLMRESTTKKAE